MLFGLGDFYRDDHVVLAQLSLREIHPRGQPNHSIVERLSGSLHVEEFCLCFEPLNHRVQHGSPLFSRGGGYQPLPMAGLGP